MKKYTIILYIFSFVVANSQALHHKNLIEINTGSSLIGIKTKKWLKNKNFVNKIYTTPIIQTSYEYNPVKKIAVAISATYQLFHIDLLPMNTNTNAIIANIHRTNIAAIAKLYPIKNTKYDIYLGLRIGNTLWTGKISFDQLRKYLTKITPSPIFKPIVEKIIEKIIPSNLRFAKNFFTLQLNTGAHYFFSKNIGVKTEISFGAPTWVTIGLNYRF